MITASLVADVALEIDVLSRQIAGLPPGAHREAASRKLARLEAWWARTEETRAALEKVSAPVPGGPRSDSWRSQAGRRPQGRMRIVDAAFHVLRDNGPLDRRALIEAINASGLATTRARTLSSGLSGDQRFGYDRKQGLWGVEGDYKGAGHTACQAPCGTD